MLRKQTQNKPKQTQFKANYKKAKMNINQVSTNGYGNICLRRREKNKPKQTQFHPHLSCCSNFLLMDFTNKLRYIEDTRLMDYNHYRSDHNIKGQCNVY